MGIFGPSKAERDAKLRREQKKQKERDRPRLERIATLRDRAKQNGTTYEEERTEYGREQLNSFINHPVVTLAASLLSAHKSRPKESPPPGENDSGTGFSVVNPSCNSFLSSTLPYTFHSSAADQIDALADAPVEGGFIARFFDKHRLESHTGVVKARTELIASLGEADLVRTKVLSAKWQQQAESEAAIAAAYNKKQQNLAAAWFGVPPEGMISIVNTLIKRTFDLQDKQAIMDAHEEHEYNMKVKGDTDALDLKKEFDRIQLAKQQDIEQDQSRQRRATPNFEAIAGLLQQLENVRKNPDLSNEVMFQIAGDIEDAIAKLRETA